jgi:PqqD family protein of HPr-rel-A system
MIRIPDTLSATSLDDELVLLDAKSGKYFGLNPVGSRIFELLKEGKAEDEAVAALRAEYGESEERLRADFKAFIAELARRGLIVMN